MGKMKRFGNEELNETMAEIEAPMTSLLGTMMDMMKSPKVGEGEEGRGG